MQKLLEIIGTSKAIRKNVFILSELLDFATANSQLAEVSRRIRNHDETIKELLQKKQGFIARIELRAVQREIKHVRRKLMRKSAQLINERFGAVA